MKTKGSVEGTQTATAAQRVEMKTPRLFFLGRPRLHVSNKATFLNVHSNRNLIMCDCGLPDDDLIEESLRKGFRPEHVVPAARETRLELQASHDNAFLNIRVQTIARLAL